MAKKFSTTIKLGNKSIRKPEKPERSDKSWSFDSKSRFDNTKAQGHKSSGTFAAWKGFSDSAGKKSTNIFSRVGKSISAGRKNKGLIKIFYTFSAVFAILLFIGLLGGLAWLQAETADLPDPEKPFDNPNFSAETSVMYDRSGQELWRLFGKDNRDSLKLAKEQNIDEVIPPELKWSILAAEDITFYEHSGFDLTGILGCAFRYVQSGSAQCGGSTITQQVVKNAGLESTKQTFGRKVRELVLSLQVERVRSKDEILLTYLNLVSQGSNVYGVKTGSRFYFGKDPKDLTLAEATVIAAIPNNPSVLSPTRSIKPEIAEERLQERRDFIFKQLLRYKDKINTEVRKSRDAKATKESRQLTEDEKKDFISDESIATAKAQVLSYREPIDNIKAPHFAYFALDLLTSRPYNEGVAFTENEIKKGGYKIYTTIDLAMQDTALKVVQEQAQGKNYGKKYGARNSAMMTMVPRTGEILTMVGSKCFNNTELADCKSLDDSEGKLFDREVNILTSQQQPGSSIKPIVYYEAFRQGKIAPGSQMADIPIEIGNYKPQNSDRDFNGVSSARIMLGESRNIPAIEALLSFGPARLAELKKEIGYTVNVDPAGYGPSSALGANDVKAVEHANAFATLANGGNYVPYEAILKIEDRQGNVIFDLNDKNKPQPKQLMDEKAAFLVNDSTNPRGATGDSSPVKWKDKRDLGGKTGTSEENKDNWFIVYSPDFVTLGWSGNNDNTPMGRQSFGSTNVEPWVRNFMEKVGDSNYFKARTPFNRPGGIATGRICGKINVNGKTEDVCEGKSDYFIEGLAPPVYSTKQVVDVCVDQQDKLARDIDKVTGNSVQKEFSYMKMPAESLQKYLDNWLKSKQGGNGAPTELCNVNRSSNGDQPWAQIMSPINLGNYTGDISVNVNAFSMGDAVTKIEFYLGNTLLGQTNNSSFLGNLSIPSGTLSGTYIFTAKVFDSKGRTGSNTANINISGVNPTLTIVAPTNNSTKPLAANIDVKASYSSQLNNLVLVVTKPDNSTSEINMDEDSDSATASFPTPLVGTYKIMVKSISPNIESNITTIQVGP